MTQTLDDTTNSVEYVAADEPFVSLDAADALVLADSYTPRDIALDPIYASKFGAYRNPTTQQKLYPDLRYSIARVLLEGGADVVYAEQAELLTADGRPEVLGFEVEDEAGNVHPAAATILGNRVRVAAPFVETPVRVRYAFRDAPEVNLANTARLPAEPFCWPTLDEP